MTPVSGAARSIPTITADQMRQVDRTMTEEYGIDLVRMSENAGRALAELAVDLFTPASVTVLAGAGGNGAGGLVAARHLANRGAAVRVVPANPDPPGVAGEQLGILRRIGVPVASGPVDADLVIDALIGYGLRGNPTGRAAKLIGWSGRQPAPVLSLDNPSGLDVTSGVPATPCVRATATLTVALPKTGLPHAPEVGELFLADIGVPPAAYRRLGVRVPPVFARATIVRVPTPTRRGRRS